MRDGVVAQGGQRLVWAGEGAQVRYRLPWAAPQPATANSVPTPKVAVLHPELEFDQTLGLQNCAA